MRPQTRVQPGRVKVVKMLMIKISLPKDFEGGCDYDKVATWLREVEVERNSKKSNSTSYIMDTFLHDHNQYGIYIYIKQDLAWSC